MAQVNPKTAPSGHVDSGAIGQRYHKTDPRYCYETAADLIIANNRQQTAMQDADLFAQHPSDSEQRLNQVGQGAGCRPAL
jgi:hypothetical protein